MTMSWGAISARPYVADALAVVPRVPLRRQLRLDLGGADAAFAPLPHALMRKYVAYAAAYCFPRLTPEAGAYTRPLFSST
jgi:DNA replicative helicase MCM subunit Mcm2 (Cdc46/Mcm family)